MLFLPAVFLHFCLAFPERRPRTPRAWLVPALYLPALVVTGAGVMSHALVASGEERGALWAIAEAIDRAKPLYFAAYFTLAVAVLVDSYRRTRGLVPRRQVKWLLWGTAAGVFPFLAFYALPSGAISPSHHTLPRLAGLARHAFALAQGRGVEVTLLLAQLASTLLFGAAVLAVAIALFERKDF